MSQFNPEICEHCGQSLTYLLPIDIGTTDIVKAIYRAVIKKGKNKVHPRKEMEVSGRDVKYREMVMDGHLTSNQVGNLSRARFHGLIAAVRGEPGFYLITRKGANFLQGEEVPKFAIISKTDKKQVGYFGEEKVKISDFIRSKNEEYWEGVDRSFNFEATLF